MQYVMFYVAAILFSGFTFVLRNVRTAEEELGDEEHKTIRNINIVVILSVISVLVWGLDQIHWMHVVLAAVIQPFLGSFLAPSQSRGVDAGIRNR
jgi:hypothetical protein